MEELREIPLTPMELSQSFVAVANANVQLGQEFPVSGDVIARGKAEWER